MTPMRLEPPSDFQQEYKRVPRYLLHFGHTDGRTISVMKRSKKRVAVAGKGRNRVKHLQRCDPLIVPLMRICTAFKHAPKEKFPARRRGRPLGVFWMVTEAVVMRLMSRSDSLFPFLSLGRGPVSWSRNRSLRRSSFAETLESS